MISPKIRFSVICFISSVSLLLDCIYAVQLETIGSPKLIGGQEADKNEFPWLVNFLTSSNVFCAGAILNNDWILTAGHCAKQVTNTTLINAGDHNLYRIDEEEQNILCQNVIVHENYNRNPRTGEIVNDIGLIKLKTPLEFNAAIKAIELQPSTLNIEAGTVTLAGWGKSNLTGDFSPILQKVNLKIISLSECQSAYRDALINVTNDSVCTGITGSPCHGDEGSPLLCKHNTTSTFVCGIYSFGGECDTNTNLPSINVKVSAYLPWIEGVMNNAQSVGSSKIFITIYVLVISIVPIISI